MTSLSDRIATALRRERAAHGWSASELGRRAGVSKATLSSLESGAGNPSVETLWALATALGIPFSVLVEGQDAGPVVVRADEAVAVASSDGGYRAALLSASPPGARRDLYLLRGEPGSPRLSDPHQRGTIEHLVLLSGEADVGPADAPVRVRPGDYVSYAGDAPHVFAAVGGPASAVLVSELR